MDLHQLALMRLRMVAPLILGVGEILYRRELSRRMDLLREVNGIGRLSQWDPCAMGCTFDELLKLEGINAHKVLTRVDRPRARAFAIFRARYASILERSQAVYDSECDQITILPPPPLNDASLEILAYLEQYERLLEPSMITTLSQMAYLAKGGLLLSRLMLPCGVVRCVYGRNAGFFEITRGNTTRWWAVPYKGR